MHKTKSVERPTFYYIIIPGSCQVVNLHKSRREILCKLPIDRQSGRRLREAMERRPPNKKKPLLGLGGVAQLLPLMTFKGLLCYRIVVDLLHRLTGHKSISDKPCEKCSNLTLGHSEFLAVNNLLN